MCLQGTQTAFAQISTQENPRISMAVLGICTTGWHFQDAADGLAAHTFHSLCVLTSDKPWGENAVLCQDQAHRELLQYLIMLCIKKYLWTHKVIENKGFESSDIQIRTSEVQNCGSFSNWLLEQQFILHNCYSGASAHALSQASNSSTDTPWHYLCEAKQQWYKDLVDNRLSGLSRTLGLADTLL